MTDERAAIETEPDSTPGVEPRAGAVLAARRPDALVALPPDRALRIGRYVLLERIGEGGMGVVFSAYDPELDRKLAVKLLRGGERNREHAERRLLREARALAKLAHPNVIAVHDAGTVLLQSDERGAADLGATALVFIAMEFVDGETLRSWLGRGPHPRASVLGVFVEAGRGLAAAHAARIVHRDFKPENVLVSGNSSGVPRDGRVRVMDFGLARGGDEPVGDGIGAPSPRGESRVTRAGAVAGTPVYMAPEQHLGAEVGPAADQFAFCVALWEALYRERPFHGDGLLELAAAVTAGGLREPPRGAGVPAWLFRVLRRGLATAPEERWPSMDALLHELERGRSRARARGVLLACGALAACVAAAIGVRAIDRMRQVAACEREGASIAELWNDERRATVREALLATKVSYAATTAEKLMPWIDRRADDWRATRIEACTAPALAAPDVQERALACLDERWMELESRLVDLEHADAGVVQRAIKAAASQVAVARCADPELLSRTSPAPEDVRDAVRAARKTLWQAESLYGAGKFAAAAELATPVVDRAIELGWPRFIAESRMRLAKFQDRAGDEAHARDEYVAGYLAAIEQHAPDLAATASSQLVLLFAVDLADLDGARLWGRFAEIHLGELGPGNDLQWAALYGNLGQLSSAAGEHDRAVAFDEQALEIRERELGADNPDVANAMHNLAQAVMVRGDPRAALALVERALAIQQNVLGVDHPDIARGLGVLGNIRFSMGDFRGALENYERGLEILERALGPQHSELATLLANIATMNYKLHRYPRALEFHMRALAIAEHALGPDHPDVAAIVSNIGIVHADLGFYPAARAMHERALAIREAKLGPDNSVVGVSLTNLAGVARQTGSFAEARALYSRSLAIQERELGRDHAQLAAPIDGLARTALAEGVPAEAIAYAERALALRTANDSDGNSPEVTETRFVLARALGESGRDPTRARALAEDALAGFRREGEDFAGYAAMVETWLREHP